MKHTPGPWEIDSILGDTVIANGENVIAFLPLATQNREANVRLIAAAPELLDACKAVLSALESHQAYDKDMRPVLRAAIRKTEIE
jgi:hypothetical protein